MIDSFDRVKFESALPVHKVTSVPLWAYRGFIDGEYVYSVPVTNPDSFTLAINIRSSIRADGHNASAGEDSIRCWLLDTVTGVAMAGKTGKYVTRVPGWEKRMEKALRRLYRLGMALRKCSTCGKMMRAGKVKKAGSPYLGKIFQKCRNRECKKPGFGWIVEKQLCTT